MVSPTRVLHNQKYSSFASVFTSSPYAGIASSSSRSHDRPFGKRWRDKVSQVDRRADLTKWRCRVNAYLQQPDIDIVRQKDPPEPTLAAQHRRWLEDNVKQNNAVNTTLSNGPLSQMSTIIDDDDRITKDLWTQFDNVCLMYNKEMVINLEGEPETMQFKKKEVWEKNVENESSHRTTIPFPRTGRCPNVWTFPERFAHLAMVAESSSIPF